MGDPVWGFRVDHCTIAMITLLEQGGALERFVSGFKEDAELQSQVAVVMERDTAGLVQMLCDGIENLPNWQKSMPAEELDLLVQGMVQSALAVIELSFRDNSSMNSPAKGSEFLQVSGFFSKAWKTFDPTRHIVRVVRAPFRAGAYVSRSLGCGVCASV